MKNCMLVVALILLLVSCKKQGATDFDPSMVGTWKHHTDNDTYRYLDILKEGDGYIQYYENNRFESATKPRRWLIKEDKLYFGWFSIDEEEFRIDQYPETASFQIIQDYDTADVGDRYMILDGGLYVD